MRQVYGTVPMLSRRNAGIAHAAAFLAAVVAFTRFPLPT